MSLYLASFNLSFYCHAKGSHRTTAFKYFTPIWFRQPFFFEKPSLYFICISDGLHSKSYKDIPKKTKITSQSLQETPDLSHHRRPEQSQWSRPPSRRRNVKVFEWPEQSQIGSIDVCCSRWTPRLCMMASSHLLARGRGVWLFNQKPPRPAEQQYTHKGK